MKIEIVEFYPYIPKNEEDRLTKKSLLGTLHVYLVDYEIDLRGITVHRHPGGIRFLMPQKFTFDHETNALVRYPVIQFTDPNKKNQLIGEIRRLGIPYLKGKI